MVFYDWNRDGKKDMVDDYLEYNIYKESTKDNDSSNYSGGSSGGCSSIFLIVLIALFIESIASYFELKESKQCDNVIWVNYVKSKNV